MDATLTDQLPELKAPQTLEESGLRLDLIVQLLTKALYFSGELTGLELAERLGLSFPVIEPGIELLKAQRMCEIVGGTSLGPPSYRYRVTDLGRERGGTFLARNMYTGVAPVPLTQYLDYMGAFRRAQPALRATRDQIGRAFSHLVLNQKVLDQLGPAVNAGHSLFVYGPPGNGKTVISQAIRNLLFGHLWIPHAIDIEGSLIQVFDPVNHERIPEKEEGLGLADKPMHDRRWNRCRRPAVMVGGELLLEHLELTYNPTSGFYRAPVQLLANGGVLIIDDFGRQQVTPRALLNRWITPLESRVDILTLQSGQKVEIPFMVLPVFATNIKPAELVDEAFLRRIQYKVFAENPTVEEFTQIFENVCREKDIAFDNGYVSHLLSHMRARPDAVLRGCLPRDLINQSLALADYLGQPRRLTPDLLDAACDTYFVNAEEGVSRA